MPSIVDITPKAATSSTKVLSPAPAAEAPTVKVELKELPPDPYLEALKDDNPNYYEIVKKSPARGGRRGLRGH